MRSRIECFEDVRRFAREPGADRTFPERVDANEMRDHVLNAPTVAASRRAPLVVGEVGDERLHASSLADDDVALDRRECRRSQRSPARRIAAKASRRGI